jgi:hypothetical protein
VNLDQINEQYRLAEQAANIHLQNGNPQWANEQHKYMQSLVAKRDALVASQAQTQGGGNTGGKSVEQILAEQEQARIDAENRRKDQEAKAYLTDLFSQYGGMQDLVGQIDQLIRDYGNSPEVLVGKVRQTETYKNRFKGLIRLQQQGVTDIRNEDQYLNLETQYRQVFREAGMRDFLGPDGTQAQFDAIGELVADYSVSVDEVRGRVNDASRVVANTSAEVRDALQTYYGITPDVLTEYVLDPERTMNKVNEIANATLIGGRAAQQGLDINRTAAEAASTLAGDSDINLGQFEREFTAAREVRDSTRRLASIEGSELTDSESFLASLEMDADAERKVRGLRSRERARFSGTSAITSSSLQGNSY